jgi:hypothetical protein
LDPAPVVGAFGLDRCYGSDQVGEQQRFLEALCRAA